MFKDKNGHFSVLTCFEAACGLIKLLASRTVTTMSTVDQAEQE